MTSRSFGFLIVFLAVSVPAAAAPISLTSTFSLDYEAEQSLWEGGPSAGFDESDRTSGNVGLYFHVFANTGTVSAEQNGALVADYLSETALGSTTNIQLQFIGDTGGGTLSSALGAFAEAGVFVDACLLDSIAHPGDRHDAIGQRCG